MSEDYKIAIFGMVKDIRGLKMNPRNKFVIVKEEENLFGVRFEAVILFPGWEDCPKRIQAYNMFRERHPDLVNRAHR